MKIELILEFLKELAANNNREWFQAHKALYQEATTEFDKLLLVLIARIGEFDPSVRHLQPKDCTWRIYRDVRFSYDKRPYKTHIGGFISAKGKKSLHLGYYYHLEPSGCFFAGGTYGLTPKQLQAVRQSIYNDIDEYRKIIEDKKFKRLFPKIGMEELKVNPKGFPKDFEYLHLLKPKDFSVFKYFEDDFYQEDGFVDKWVELAKTAKPFLDFINYTVDDFERQ